MLTIDEAIKHAEDKAKDQRARAETTGIDGLCLCAEQHEQLAEWLKELKARRAEDNSGEWIAQGKEYIECNRCNTWFKKRYLPYGNFCCKCGAKMKERTKTDKDM